MEQSCTVCLLCQTRVHADHACHTLSTLARTLRVDSSRKDTVDTAKHLAGGGANGLYIRDRVSHMEGMM